MKEYYLDNILCFNRLKVIELFPGDLIDFDPCLAGTDPDKIKLLEKYFNGELDDLFINLLIDKKKILTHELYDYVKEKKYDCVLINKSIKYCISNGELVGDSALIKSNYKGEYTYSYRYNFTLQCPLVDRIYISDIKCNNDHIHNMVKLYMSDSYYLSKIINSYLPNIHTSLDVNGQKFHLPATHKQIHPVPIWNIWMGSPHLEIGTKLDNISCIVNIRSWYLQRNISKILIDYQFILPLYNMITGGGTGGYYIRSDSSEEHRKKLKKIISCPRGITWFSG